MSFFGVTFGVEGFCRFKDYSMETGKDNNQNNKINKLKANVPKNHSTGAFP